MIRCDAPGCVRGLVHRAEGWADPCSVCKGAGELTVAEICRRIDENEGTIARLIRGRKMRSRTLFRLAGKLAELCT